MPGPAAAVWRAYRAKMKGPKKEEEEDWFCQWATLKLRNMTPYAIRVSPDIKGGSIRQTPNRIMEPWQHESICSIATDNAEEPPQCDINCTLEKGDEEVWSFYLTFGRGLKDSDDDDTWVAERWAFEREEYRLRDGWYDEPDTEAFEAKYGEEYYKAQRDWDEIYGRDYKSPDDDPDSPKSRAGPRKNEGRYYSVNVGPANQKVLALSDWRTFDEFGNCRLVVTAMKPEEGIIHVNLELLNKIWPNPKLVEKGDKIYVETCYLNDDSIGNFESDQTVLVQSFRAEQAYYVIPFSNKSKEDENGVVFVQSDRIDSFRHAVSDRNYTFIVDSRFQYGQDRSQAVRWLVFHDKAIKATEGRFLAAMAAKFGDELWKSLGGSFRTFYRVKVDPVAANLSDPLRDFEEVSSQGSDSDGRKAVIVGIFSQG